MSNQLPDFQTISDALHYFETLGGAAETHGLLCALLCGAAGIGKNAWVDSLQSSFHDAKDATFQKNSDTLVKLFDATKTNIDSDEFDIALLLPGDDEPLHLRIESLAHWCQGFLSGLKLLGMSAKNTQSPEVQEAMDHLLRISCLEYEPTDEVDAEAEASYTELVEFVRMSVILLHSVRQEILTKRPNIAGNQTVH